MATWASAPVSRSSAPGSRPAYTAMGHLYFESLDAFQAGFAQHGQTFMADVRNYTDIEPQIQISDVKM